MSRTWSADDLAKFAGDLSKEVLDNIVHDENGNPSSTTR